MEATANSVFELAQTLSKTEQWTLVEELLSHLKGASPKRKAKDPSAPKKPMTPYIELVNKIVWPVLKELSETEEDPEEKKILRSVPARTQVASKLWSTLSSKDDLASVTEDAILKAYEEWKSSPHEAKPKARKSKKSESESESEASVVVIEPVKPVKPVEPVSEPESEKPKKARQPRKPRVKSDE